MMAEKICFENSKGDKLYGILSDPINDKSKSIIVICHGLSSNKDGRTAKTLEIVLNKNKISTFRFDFYGHGESEGKFEDITVSEAVDDTEKAIELMKEKGYQKIGLAGSSFGGITCLIVASRRKDLFVLALKSPVSDYQIKEIEKRGEKGIEEWKRKGYVNYEGGDGTIFKLKYSFFDDFGKNKTGYEAAKEIGIPVLIVHGDEDDIVPVEQSIKTGDILEKGRLEIIKGTDHDYDKKEYFEQMIKLISDFISENLIK